MAARHDVRVKTCRTCGQAKSLDEFGVVRSNPDGRRHACRECFNKVRERYRQNRRRGIVANVQEPGEHSFPGSELTAEAVEFGKAMEEYKRINGRRFPGWSEALKVLKSMGYRKVKKAGPIPRTTREGGRLGGGES